MLLLGGLQAAQFFFMPLNIAQMQQNVLKCSNRVGDRRQCPCSSEFYVKHGKTGAGKQRYKCKACSKTYISDYCNKAYITPDTSITALLVEGCGIRSISRLLNISNTTVLKRILLIAKNISKPIISFNKTYEVDEMRTFYKSKTRLLWIVIALRSNTKQVADFAVGTRTIKTLKKVIDTVLLSGAEKIYTDKLHLYNYIIPANIHSCKKYGTNHIERKNLSLRTHLKRLNRRTICFSKSTAVLIACLKIYFWS